MKHEFTETILWVLKEQFGDSSSEIFEKSELLQYINLKTKSANRGSKSRGSFANLYAIYVIIEDYLKNGFDKNETYSKSDGAEFSKLFKRQRELPFGAKLQNHALNNRMNAEFQKFFPSTEYTPIIRNLETNRYWINENCIKVKVGSISHNISEAIIMIIDSYTKAKEASFNKFLKACLDLKDAKTHTPEEVEQFILGLIEPNADARLFEIVSYSILKFHYNDQKVYWGFDLDNLEEDTLKLFKTGRTNANDGGIDFVMKPLGRFFQVTETLDVKKYFLDIDKIHRYPITFVVKSSADVATITTGMKSQAMTIYPVESVVEKYMQCIEEIINIPTLHKHFTSTVKQGYLDQVLDEIILQSKVEFNYSLSEESDEDDSNE